MKSSYLMWCVWSLLLLLFGEPTASVAQPSPTGPLSLREPVAIAALPSGKLVILERRGRLLEFSPETETARVLVKGFSSYVVLDLAGSGVDESVFVTMTRRMGRTGRAVRVVRVSEVGDLVEDRIGVGPMVFAGVAPDLGDDRIFLSATRSGEIRVLPASPAVRLATSQLVRIPRASILGPLTFDDQTERLFVADPSLGSLHQVDLRDGRVDLLTEELGEPAALTLDREGTSVLVADAGRSLVWRVSLDPPKAEPEVFTDHEALKWPQGISTTLDGTVWVVDSRTNQLLAFSPEGEHLMSLP